MATKYQALVKEQSLYCKGKRTKAQVNKKKKAYVADAKKKGKSAKEANAVANRVTRKCSRTKVSGTKKRRTKK